MRRAPQRLFAATALLAAVAACGGREAHPVAAHSAIDSRLTCGHIDAQMATNQRRIEMLSGEGDRAATNAAGNLLALGPVAALMTINAGDAEDEEAAALVKRNAVLADLAAEKGCAPQTAQTN